MAAGATIKHFAACNGVTVELLNPWYSDLRRDFERLIGRPHLDGEKLVRNCQLFAFGVCPTCGNNHPTQRLIRYAKYPSLHQCGARCRAAKGPNCECSCSGANHGSAI
jgi:hypothetical protein